MTDAGDTELPLQSWKEIAAYLGRDARTVRRWEQAEGLPVHRHRHLARSTVYAYRGELDAWRVARGADPRPATRPQPSRPIIAVAALALLTFVTAGGGRIDGVSPGALEQSGNQPTSWVPPPTVSIHGKVSPDGRWLPYVDDEARDGFVGSLMLRDLVSGATRRVEGFPRRDLVQQAEYAENSAFSRDGGRLAYAWRVRARDVYQLRVVPATTSVPETPRVVFDNPEVSWLAPYDWTPDGRSIAVVLQRKDRTAALGLVASDTGAFLQLKSVEWDSVSNVALSPDGQLVAFDRRQPDGARDVFVLAVDGSRESAVVSSKADDSLVGWAPDGKRLLFLSDRSGSVDLWAVSIPAGKMPGDVQHLRSNVGRFWPAGVTRDGSVMAAVVSTGGSQLKIADLNVEPGRGEALRVLDEFVGPSTPLSWSPDGRRLVSVSQYIGMRPLTPLFRDSAPRLTVHAIDANDSAVLPRAFQYVNSLDWAPDGQTLVVAGADLLGRTGVFRIDTRTGVSTAIVLTPGEQPTMPTRWTALFSQRLYYQRNVIATQTARLVEHDLATGVEREILPWAPRFADGPPDPRPVRTIVGLTHGRQILYILRTRPDGESVLRLLSLETGADRELMRAPQPETLAVLDLLPDHKTAFVVRKNAAGQSEIWLAPLQSTASVTKVATTTEDLTTYRVLSPADVNGLLLSKRASTPGALEIWRLSTEGTLVLFRRLPEQDRRLGSVARISPDRSRLAFVTEYQPPAAPLELVVIENVLGHGQRQ